MKINRTKLLTLMAALAAGSAAAAGTTAGTSIQNIATVNYIDPATGTAAAPIDSNSVSTTVLPVAGLDIVYTDGSPDGNTASTPAVSADKSGVLPGSKVTTAYTVLNNGNIDNYVVNLAADSTGSATTVSAANVQYFLASDTTFSTPITSVTVPASGKVDVIQRLTIPANAVPGAQYSVSPHGTAAAGSNNGNPYGAVDEAANVNTPPTPAANNDLEFTRATVYAPTVVNYPTPPTDPTNPNTPSTPPSVTVIPPTPANPGTPTNPVSPPGTPGDPSDPSVPGYPDPLNPSTAIQVSGNTQIAYPTADTNPLSDFVAFKNVVATPVNAATQADRISLFPTDATGNPIGTNNGNGTFSVPAIGGNPAFTLSFSDTNGTALPTATNTADGKVYPVISLPAGGGQATYRSLVTFPDSNPNSNTATSDTPAPVVVVIGADSTNDSDITANGTTTDTVMPAAAAFGDVPASGTAADRSLIGPNNAAQIVVPGAAAASGAPSSTTNTDSTAVFPMLINNTGKYNDTYTLSGTVPIKTTTGTINIVNVRYVDAWGMAPASGAAGDTFVTPLVAAGSNLTVYAVVDVPATAKATTGGNPASSNPNPVLTQNATGNYSTIPLTDLNDQLQIGSTGIITAVKTQSANGAPYSAAAQSAKPGQTLNYRVIITNKYNGPVAGVNLIEKPSNTAFTFTNFVSASTTLTGFVGKQVVYYSVDNGATFTTTSPAAGTDLSSKGLIVAVDTDATTGIDAGDLMPENATITLDINTTVK